MSTHPIRRRSASPRKISRPSTQAISSAVKEVLNDVTVQEKEATIQIDERKRVSRGTPRRRSSYDPSDVRKQTADPGTKKSTRSNSRRRPTRTRSDDVSSSVRPKLCNDQLRSMEMLLSATDPVNEVNENGDVKKRSRKKKEREVREQMERRALLNLQFNAIQELLDGMGILEKSSEQTDLDNVHNDTKRGRKKYERDDHTVHFDPFAINDSPLRQKSERTKCREMSFRDLLGNNQHRLKSFRDLTRVDADMCTNRQPMSQFRDIPTVPEAEDPFAINNYDGDDVLDFESVMWGLPTSKKETTIRNNFDDKFSRFQDVTDGTPMSDDGKFSAELLGRHSERLSPGPKIRNNRLVSSDHKLTSKYTFDCQDFIKPTTLSRPSGFEHKSSRRASSGSNESGKHNDSINSNYTKKSDNEIPMTPVKKKKKKASDLTARKSKSNDEKPLWNENILCVQNSSSNTEREKSNWIASEDKIDFNFDNSIRHSNFGKNKSFGKQKFDLKVRDDTSVYDFDPQKTPSIRDLQKLKLHSNNFTCESMRRLDFSNPPNIHTEEKIAESNMIAFSPFDIVGKKDDDEYETSDHIFVE